MLSECLLDFLVDKPPGCGPLVDVWKEINSGSCLRSQLIWKKKLNGWKEPKLKKTHYEIENYEKKEKKERLYANEKEPWGRGRRASLYTHVAYILSVYFLNWHYHSVLILWNMIEGDILKHSTGIIYFKHFILLGRMIWET